MQNYHRHTSYSNIYVADSAAVNEDYAKRAVELGHKVICSLEHGWAGYYFEAYELAKKYDLKFIFGCEAYWVKNRLEKDRTNGHIVLLAKNENGRRAINRIMSTANEDGYYFRPRVDLELLLTLPADDVMVTTACIAFWHYDDIEDILVQLHNHFKKNLFLEIQYHDTESQIKLNKRILALSEKYNIEMIVGMDSHYIYPDQSKERDYILAAKNVHYEDEDGWFMDYPDDETTMNRFLKQDVFTKDQIQRAMDNTDLLLEFEGYDTLPNGEPNRIFSKDIKLPSLYDGNHTIDGVLLPKLDQEQRNKEYSKLISKLFKEYMKGVDESQYNDYFEGVKSEVQTIKDTNMSDYFLIDYYMVKRALEKGGVLTDSGRGSSVGYFTNTLLGFSKVDRFQSPIKLYPERFISKSRILETKSLPDIDLNWGTPDIAAEAQEEILGKDHAYPMIAFGTCKKKSAFKLYARSQNMDFDLANTISGQIEKYDEALKYADDDEKDDINIYDYVDEEYHSYIDASKKYQGIIMDKKKAPCFPKGSLIYTNYGYMPIENISVGMKVLTHTGEFHNVLYVNETDNKEIYKLSVIGREPIYATPNHPFYCRKLHRKEYINPNGKRSIKKTFDHPRWCELQNIKLHDVVGSPVNQVSNIPHFAGLDEYMSNPNFWWIIGRYLGDGWCEYYEPENRVRIKICCAKTKDEVTDIKTHLDGLFNYRIDECKTVYKFLIKENKLYDFLQSFNSGAENKIIPQFVIDLPELLLKSFIDGYISADGHYQKINNQYIISSTSKHLIYGLQQCIHKVYKVPTTFYIRKAGVDVIEGRKVRRKESYILKYHLDKRKNDRCFYEDGFMWYWVKDIETMSHKEKVYNFEVEKDHSYTVLNISVHNCAYLLYDGSIREEIGLIKCKSETTKKEYMTAVIDGAIAENYKFLKNDILKVDVVLLIDLIYKRIGLKHHTVNELMKLVKNDQAVWDIYANGYTMGVNQVEKASTTRKSMKYKPRNVSELSAFIAAIRPAFKSMYSKLENREDFSYGIPAFDKILQTEELPQSFILYQEQTMNTLNYAGFPIDECYGIIKAIAKKHPEKVKPLKERFITGFKDKIMQDDGIPADKAEEDSARVWQIISDSCGYGFNSAHAYCMALDSLYNAYLKAHYPYEFYEVLLQTYSDKGKKDKVAELKQEMSKAFGIKEGDYKFGLDNRKFIADPENQTIYPSLLSIKGLSQGCANDLYALGQKKYDNFYELWKDMKKKKNLNSGKINTLIEIGYFDDFGTIGKIKRFIEILDQLYDRSQFSKTNPPVEFLSIIKKYSEETDKQYRKFDYDAALTEIWETLEDTDIPFNERLKYELQNIGYVKTLVPDMSPDYAFVQDFECKYKNPKLTLYRLCDGTTEVVKVRRKKYDEAPINVGDIIKTIECSEEGRWSKDQNGDWQQDNSDKENILKKWSFVRDDTGEEQDI